MPTDVNFPATSRKDSVPVLPSGAASFPRQSGILPPSALLLFAIFQPLAFQAHEAQLLLEVQKRVFGLICDDFLPDIHYGGRCVCACAGGFRGEHTKYSYVSWATWSQGQKVARRTHTYNSRVALLVFAPNWSRQLQSCCSAAARSQRSLPARPRRRSTAPGSTSSLRKLSGPLTTAQSSCGKCPADGEVIHSL